MAGRAGRGSLATKPLPSSAPGPTPAVPPVWFLGWQDVPLMAQPEPKPTSWHPVAAAFCPLSGADVEQQSSSQAEVCSHCSPPFQHLQGEEGTQSCLKSTWMLLPPSPKPGKFHLLLPKKPILRSFAGVPGVQHPPKGGSASQGGSVVWFHLVVSLGKGLRSTWMCLCHFTPQCPTGRGHGARGSTRCCGSRLAAPYHGGGRERI